MAAGDGLVIMTPTSIAYSGTFAGINSDGGVDFTAVTSLSLNGVFTSSFDNYCIVWYGINTVQTRGLRLRLRLSGTDATGTDYTFQNLTASSTTVSGSRTTSADHYQALSQSTVYQGYNIHSYGPALAQATAFRSVGISTGNTAQIADFAGTHSLATAYDGVTLYPGGDAMTGNVVVFGYEE